MKNMGKPLAFALVFLLAMAMIVRLSGQTVPWGEESGTDFSYGAGATDLYASAGAGLPLEAKLATLEDLGFTFTGEEKTRFQEWPEAGYAELLASCGWGDWDTETWEWTPGSDQVYALDLEVFNLERMYPDFFQGLLSISDGQVPITDVEQDDSGVNWDRGTGNFVVTLHYDGRPYRLRLKAQNDWMDPDVLRQVNDILKQEGQEKRYYAAWSSPQDIVIFYCGREWAETFEKKTGCTLFTALS